MQMVIFFVLILFYICEINPPIGLEVGSLYRPCFRDVETGSERVRMLLRKGKDVAQIHSAGKK